THWQSPIVANGVVYVNDNAAHLRSYALPNAAPAFTSAASAAFQVGVAGSFAVAASGAPAPALSEAGALPSGVTFTATTGSLAGTPGPGTAGTYPLQFTASNGITPDAVQAFALTVNPAASGPAQLSFSDAACTNYVLSGTPPNQTLTCASGSNSPPVCAPTANPPAPNARQSTTISANCSNQPSPNAYMWTGSGCTAVTTESCTVSQFLRRTITFSVRASNAAGQGPPAQITVTWK
ncbi:MAG TPA: putative Ig domain-containing protein, partial [Casimicrobiaceae bacterium]|nr:putative Ig domain-containing protein [Casimicrobiaceae bacterium]